MKAKIFREVIVEKMKNYDVSNFETRQEIYKSSRRALARVCSDKNFSKRKSGQVLEELETAISGIELSFQLNGPY